MFAQYWTITGNDPFADALRSAVPYIPSERAISISTVAESATPERWVAGPAVLDATTGRYAPYYAAFEAIEEVRNVIRSGAAGKLYGLFGSFRVSRETPGEALPTDALLPLIGIALDLIDDRITRVWATNCSLLANGDAWFIHLRTATDILLTLEVLACCAPGAAPELLLEITAHDRVLRAEPTRQSVIVEPLDRSATGHPWWEDLNERYLQLIIKRNEQPDDGAAARIRSVWSAMQQSAGGGEAVTLG